MGKKEKYEQTLKTTDALIQAEDDFITILSTVVCELHSINYFHWTGFYRVTEPGVLKVGPYQGSHGCLRIPFSKGICGLTARTEKSQIVPDVNAVPDHIACSSSTQSEIVVPLFRGKELVAVLDVDSNDLGAFDEHDLFYLEQVCDMISKRL